MTPATEGAAFVAGPLCDVATPESRRYIWAKLLGPDDLEAVPSTEAKAWETRFVTAGSDGLPPPSTDASTNRVAGVRAKVSDVYLSLRLHPYFLLER
jgi:hypothetical protein